MNYWRKIHLSEDSRLELKTVTFRGNKVAGPHADGLADKMAAFANSSGGVVVLGINEKTKEPRGISLEESAILEHWLLGFLQRLHIDRRRAFFPLLDVKADPPAFVQQAEALHLDDRIRNRSGFSCL